MVKLYCLDTRYVVFAGVLFCNCLGEGKSDGEKNKYIKYFYFLQLCQKLI